jgi:hypothetical protein
MQPWSGTVGLDPELLDELVISIPCVDALYGPWT